MPWIAKVSADTKKILNPTEKIRGWGAREMLLYFKTAMQQVHFATKHSAQVRADFIRHATRDIGDTAPCIKIVKVNIDAIPAYPR